MPISQIGGVAKGRSNKTSLRVFCKNLITLHFSFATAQVCDSRLSLLWWCVLLEYVNQSVCVCVCVFFSSFVPFVAVHPLTFLTLHFLFIHLHTHTHSLSLTLFSLHCTSLSTHHTLPRFLSLSLSLV
jgi:hypothetical protein